MILRATDEQTLSADQSSQDLGFYHIRTARLVRRSRSLPNDLWVVLRTPRIGYTAESVHSMLAKYCERLSGVAVCPNPIGPP